MTRVPETGAGKMELIYGAGTDFLLLHHNVSLSIELDNVALQILDIVLYWIVLVNPAYSIQASATAGNCPDRSDNAQLSAADRRW